jgi:hypothetical protein
MQSTAIPTWLGILIPLGLVPRSLLRSKIAVFIIDTP